MSRLGAVTDLRNLVDGFSILGALVVGGGGDTAAAVDPEAINCTPLSAASCLITAGVNA